MQWWHGSGAVRRAFALMPINIQIRMNCARFEWSGPNIAPDGLRMVLHHLQACARNSRAPLAAGFEEGQAAAVVVQVCHASSAAAPNTCTMSHHVQDGGQQAAAAGHQECHAGPASTPIVPVRYPGCPNKCTMSQHAGEWPKETIALAKTSRFTTC